MLTPNWGTTEGITSAQNKKERGTVPEFRQYNDCWRRYWLVSLLSFDTWACCLLTRTSGFRKVGHEPAVFIYNLDGQLYSRLHQKWWPAWRRRGLFPSVLPLLGPTWVLQPGLGFPAQEKHKLLEWVPKKPQRSSKDWSTSLIKKG